ncbi:hypothetical protein OG864_29880 [Streptomyces sp. NBC_00124]|uniref:hypothetical protein n=1 Tax=Streptomyces sp. NBC_00124 TaxID=2975662 RepID=UPI0022520D1A|nr:hypothetical protein [Streptomyces sp. NBC_00124]MCX5362912.1 hypothetical protein [Streptomyces sp. NBC_00124]
MIRPTLTADGTAVRLPLADRAAPLLDELAVAFADRPEDIAALLRAHAASVLALDYAVCADHLPDHVRAVRAAQADGSREALLDECPAAEHLDEQLGPDAAITLGTRLTKYAAHIRLTRSSRP